ncbi:MAG: hypothetical protein ACOC8N_02395 [Spirochaetota bacterium]
MRALLILPVLLLAVASTGVLLAQETPGYDFITFQAGYDGVLGAARAEGYQAREEDTLSPFGSYHVVLDRSGQFYREEIFLFFSGERQLISFNVRYTLLENQPRTILRKLVESITGRLEEKYGESQREAVPYFRVYENDYEIMVYPPAPASESTRVSFKHLERTAAHREHYRQEVEQLVDQEIEQTVDKL